MASGFLEAIEVEFFQFFIAFFDGAGGFGEEGFQKCKEAGGIEGVEGMGGEIAGGTGGGINNDAGEPWTDLLDGGEEMVAGHVDHAGVGDEAVEGGEFAQGFDGFLAGVGGDDVELGGFDDELAGGDTGGSFTVNDEEAGTDQREYLAGEKDRVGLKTGRFGRGPACRRSCGDACSGTGSSSRRIAGLSSLISGKRAHGWCDLEPNARRVVVTGWA